jgi:hypothetical protein
VTVERVPGGGIQPQVAVDASGGAHLLYFKGDPAHGDLFYARRTGTGSWSVPLRVNSRPGSAMATGSMRGGHLAIGRGGRVHVAWHGSDRAAADGTGPAAGSPVLYARLNDARAAFEPERRVAPPTFGLDAGTVAADPSGRVMVLWHAPRPGQPGEEHRAVWIAESSDDGRTFGAGRPLSPPVTGACGCCSVGALADRRGTLYVLFRSAGDLVHRDAYLLTRSATTADVRSDRLQAWNIGACPMSTFALSESASGVLAAWETNGQVQWLRIDPASGGRSGILTPTGAPGSRKHPAIGGNSRGETLLAWTEGTAWNKGGELAWQRFDRERRPIGAPSRAPGVPVWGLVAIAPGPDEGFLVLY